MPPPLDIQRQLSRFTRLPEVQDVWEGAIVPLPTWVDTPGGDPYRPQAAVWASTSRQRAQGSNEEAVLCAHDLLEPWSATPGAVEWLRAETRKGR